MTGETAQKGSPSIGPLILALAKTFHWAGLYGTDHPILSKRTDELHAALLARLSDESEGRLYLGIARDKILYRNEFFGGGQDIVARFTESLYLRQVATLGLEPSITPEGLLSLFRYLHESLERKTQVSAEQFLRENGITQARRRRGWVTNRRMLSHGMGGLRVAGATAGFSCILSTQK